MSDNKSFYLYTVADCSFCKKAKELIEKEGHAQVAWEVSPEDPRLDVLKQKANWKTVPMVYEYEGVNHKFIGGYTELRDYLGGGDSE
jgi:glutaredoxin